MSSEPLTQFFHVRDLLSIYADGDGVPRLVIYDGSRVVVPRPARKGVLKALHLAHAGEVKSYANARQLYYWPGMKNDITQSVRSCLPCQSLLPSQAREPLAMLEAEFPMDQVSVDLFSLAGQDWLAMVDRFSGFPFAARLRNTSTDSTFGVLLGWFREWGFPGTIRSDNGPQFGTKFAQLCQAHGIKHETSSPYCPASNGLAEAAVKSVKFLLNKCLQSGENFADALLEWRIVPRTDGVSPAQAFLGRRQRTTLPYIHPSLLDKEFSNPGQNQFDFAKDVRSEF